VTAYRGENDLDSHERGSLKNEPGKIIRVSFVHLEIVRGRNIFDHEKVRLRGGIADIFNCEVGFRFLFVRTNNTRRNRGSLPLIVSHELRRLGVHFERKVESRGRELFLDCRERAQIFWE